MLELADLAVGFETCCAHSHSYESYNIDTHMLYIADPTDEAAEKACRQCEVCTQIAMEVQDIQKAMKASQDDGQAEEHEGETDGEDSDKAPKELWEGKSLSEFVDEWDCLTRETLTAPFWIKCSLCKNKRIQGFDVGGAVAIRVLCDGRTNGRTGG